MRIVAFGDMINREEMEDEEFDETVGFQMSELLFRLRCAPFSNLWKMRADTGRTSVDRCLT